MNSLLLLSGLVSGLATFAHAIGGELTNLRHMDDSSIPKNERIELRLVWHALTILLLLSSLFLLSLGLEDRLTGKILLVQFIGILFIIIVIMFFFLILQEDNNFFHRCLNG